MQGEKLNTTYQTLLLHKRNNIINQSYTCMWNVLMALRTIPFKWESTTILCHGTPPTVTSRTSATFIANCLFSTYHTANNYTRSAKSKTSIHLRTLIVFSTIWKASLMCRWGSMPIREYVSFGQSFILFILKNARTKVLPMNIGLWMGVASCKALYHHVTVFS